MIPPMVDSRQLGDKMPLHILAVGRPDQCKKLELFIHFHQSSPVDKTADFCQSEREPLVMPRRRCDSDLYHGPDGPEPVFEHRVVMIPERIIESSAVGPKVL